MPESPLQASSGVPAAKDGLVLLEILKLLIETKKARTTADLLKYAGQYGAAEAEERLRVMDAEGIPLDLAFDAVSVHLRLLAFKRNSVLIAGCSGQKVGMILPLPPHVPHLFLPVAQVEFLHPQEDVSLSGLHEFSEHAIKGARACRAKAQEMQALVFEAFREGARLFVDEAVADVLEPKMLPAGIRLIAHLRPHRNPGDVAFEPLAEVAFI